MVKKNTDLQDITNIIKKLATRNDIEQYVLRMNRDVMGMVRKNLTHWLDGIGTKLDELHKEISINLKLINKNTKFLEREIIVNRLKIKELEDRLNELAQPKPKLPN